MKRWTPKRKAEIVEAIKGRHLTVLQACQRYGLTPEEVQAWQRRFARDGLAGLKATKREGARA